MSTGYYDRKSERPVLDSKLTEVRDGILRLGSLVNQAIRKAIEAFHTDNEQLAHEAGLSHQNRKCFENAENRHMVTVVDVAECESGAR